MNARLKQQRQADPSVLREPLYFSVFLPSDINTPIHQNIKTSEHQNIITSEHHHHHHPTRFILESYSPVLSPSRINGLHLSSRPVLGETNWMGILGPRYEGNLIRPGSMILVQSFLRNISRAKAGAEQAWMVRTTCPYCS
jgi:hypothetical protein